MKFHVFLTLVFILFVRSSNAEFNFASYSPSSLENAQATFDDLRSSLGEKGDKYLAILEKHKYIATYTGEFRPLSSESISFIVGFTKSANLDPNMIQMFKHEMKVTFEGKEYFLPVQEQLIPYMQKELEINNEFAIYAVFAGGYGKNAILLVGEFGTP